MVVESASEETDVSWRILLRDRQVDRLALALALCLVPVSIAGAEALLVVALVARTVRVLRHRSAIRLPGVLLFWLAWAVLEIFSWGFSPNLKAGLGEMRHLLLLGALFWTLPALEPPTYRVAVWQGIFLSASLSSLFLIGDFASRLIYYRRELAVTTHPSFYLRSGGLLNHWMVWGTVEILVFAALIEFSSLYPRSRRLWLPVLAINTLAIVVSLTRMVWVCCLLLLGIELAWRRSRWILAVPLLPIGLFVLAPGVIRSRFKESASASFYANAERAQMLRVGWQMVREKPLTGIGPGRVGKLYRQYLSPADPVPAYYGHLHNNLAQLAAQFGLPVAAAALIFAAALLNDLRKQWRVAADPQEWFTCRTAILGCVGFLAAGLVDYTYGHSLGLILLCFVTLSPLVPASSS